MKRLSVASGAFFGVACATGLAALALWRPDQVDLPFRALPVVWALVATMLGLASAALTLCGLDLAASRFHPI